MTEFEYNSRKQILWEMFKSGQIDYPEYIEKLNQLYRLH